MQALINTDAVKQINTKQLCTNVIKKFDEYNKRQIIVKTTEELENIQNYNTKFVTYFENKINYIKTQFTEDEKIIYENSIENRKKDKEIMSNLCKKGHSYYDIKKSCYLKIALGFGIVEVDDTID